MIAVPTTAGTGSEAQSFALISDAKTHVKMACGDKKASCRIAILDPKLTVTQPRTVTALTGIDAIAHALETFVTKPRNSASMAFSREAWRLLSSNFSRVLADPEDIVARGEMQLGACFAGMAIENSMLGAAHAMANPLTATFDVVHGQAVGAMLPHVVRLNGMQYNTWYRDLLETTGNGNGKPAPSGGANSLADYLTALVDKAGLATRLSELGVARESIPDLAQGAAKQWTGRFNPRSAEPHDFQAMYEAAY
jgi:alcohol dehydrogenase